MYYDHLSTESKWRKFWQDREVYATAGIESNKPKYYVLDMFPYPSGAGLHVGHPRGYIASDVFARFKRMNGFNVLHPMGFDSFGLPAEQYAIKTGNHPGPYTDELVEHYKQQLSGIGFSYDWSREVSTHRPEYYKWTQWIFLQLFNAWYNPATNKTEKIETCIAMLESTDPKWPEYSELEKQNILMNYRIAYQGYAEVNWCPELGTVLANDEIITAADGSMVSERGEYPVVRKSMRQWFMRISSYADRLLSGLDGIDWPESIKTIQKNWIGKNEGAEVDFEIIQDLPKSFYQNENDVSLSSEEQDLPPTPSKGGGVFAQQKPGYITTNSKKYKELYDKALEMRKDPTESEKLIWESIRSQKLGFKFRQQHIINEFIVDFVCLEKKVILEIDGGVHDSQKERDQERTAILEALGFSVLRFSNDEVKNSIQSVLKTIESELQKAPSFGGGWGEVCTVFTTRADTLFGVTYVVLAPEHDLVQKLSPMITNWSEVSDYIAKVKATSEDDRVNDKNEKTGICLEGITAINPANGESVPVWIANYVLASYGTGAVMAVPAHDERDFEFAKKYDLSIVYVNTPNSFTTSTVNSPATGNYKSPGEELDEILKTQSRPLTSDDSTLVNSGEFTGFDSEKARALITEKYGRPITKFRMRDAIFARQRYWGEPIPLRHVLSKNENEKIILSFYDDNIWNDILSGKKTVETRALNPEETERYFGDIGIGDVVKFINKNTGESIFVCVKDVRSYKTLVEAFEDKVTLLKTQGRDFNSVSELETKYEFTKDYLEKINNNGLVAWEFELIKIVEVVSENELPLILPELDDFAPAGNGQSPLAKSPEWMAAGYETNTMPGWAGSSWYFLRYMDPSNENAFASVDAVDYWRDVDMYVGGAEHATGHLLYARFWHKALHDLGYVPTDEPFRALRNQGMIAGTDGRKMSKRWGNIINPDDVVAQLGADTLRVYESFMGPFEAHLPWSTDGIVGSRRFIERVYKLAVSEKVSDATTDKDTLVSLHKAIKKVTEDINSFSFNTAISAMMIAMNDFEKAAAINKNDFAKFLQILAPFAPFITEDLWHKIHGDDAGSIHLAPWPTFDPELLVADTITMGVQVNGKVRGEITLAPNATQDEAFALAQSDESIAKWIAGEPKKVVYVAGRILNIIV
jgi:leucyl-tRNA synthetase/ASC-1-like (ASCH) protein